MEVKNAVMPNDQQMAGFLEEGEDKPIFMVNLLKFKEKAVYPDKRETDLTGEQAYAIYGQEIGKQLEKVGAKTVFSGKVSRLMLGKVEDLWDQVAIARYPNRKAMLDMLSDPEYIKSAQHRVAGLEGQLNIETNSTAGF
ncbi:uncharacterized protein METZ01_LOCUS83229 [marine metagenome]|uniref:DUF1330 domain-containing protein n=1 Tax=marine metagenome TaxID=408172 RepID=A0A381UQD6_9ZZZZ